MYGKSTGTKMNELDLCLEVVSRSRQPLRYTWRWISRKPLDIEAWFQRTTSRKWHMAYRVVTWPMMSRDRRRCCEAVRSAILATAWLIVLFRSFKLLRMAAVITHSAWNRYNRCDWLEDNSSSPSLNLRRLMQSATYTQGLMYKTKLTRVQCHTTSASFRP